MFLLLIDSVLSNEGNIKDKEDDNDGVKNWTIAAQLLLPLAALAILWGRKGFLAKLFLQFDKNCISVICPSISKQQRLLKWASSRLTTTWSPNSSISAPIDFWKNGSLLCTLINSAIPGACSNPHRHWKKPSSHGQLLAYKYLGVSPVFTETELGEPTLSLKNEKLLIQYLTDIQQAISNMSTQDFKYSSYYVARGMGLVVGEQHRKTVFYIYPYSRKSSNKHDVFVTIKGPFNTTSSATIPGKFTSRNTFTTNLIDKKRLTYQTKAQKLFFRSFSVDFGSFIYPKQPENDENYIPMRITSEKDRVKLVYIPKNNGIYEISIIVNGFHLLGSPYSVSIADNTSQIYDTLSDSNSNSKKDRGKSIKRRVISKIIDFIDEKITYSSETKSAQVNISKASTNTCVLTNVRELNHNEYEIANQSSGHDDIGMGSSSSTSSDFNNNKLSTYKKLHCLDDEDKNIYDDVPFEDNYNEEINSGRPTSRNAIVDVLADFHNNFDTSPIFENNIENEVSDKIVEPRAHKRSKRSSLQRQENVPDVVSNDNKLLANEESLQDELVRSLIEDCKETKNYLDSNERFNNQRKNTPKPKKRNIFSKSSSMEILNVLSKLKEKNSNGNLNKNHLKNLTTSNISLNEYQKKCFQNEGDKSYLEAFPNLRERVLYWESLINLNILETTKSCKHRNSLPNLFSSSQSENPDITYNKSVDFKTQFKKRHEYWKVLSSQAESCSSLRSSIDYLCNGSDNTITNRRSLPDIYYNYFRDDDEKLDFKSSIDFYESEDVDSFRIKFRECKNYWERLCSNQKSYDELYYIDRNSIIQEVNLDGGFSASVPDLLIKNSNFGKASFLNAYNLKDLYKIRKDYWEAICLYAASDDSKINTSYVTNLERDQFLNFEYDMLTNKRKSKANVLNVYNTN